MGKPMSKILPSERNPRVAGRGKAEKTFRIGRYSAAGLSSGSLFPSSGFRPESIPRIFLLSRFRGMTNTPQLAPFSSFVSQCGKRGLPRGSSFLRLLPPVKTDGREYPSHNGGTAG
jgi:hypothetical protein